MPGRRNRVIETAEGTNPASFHSLDWGMLGFNTLVWGASFLFIAISLEGFTPGMLAWLRIALGAAILALFPMARRRIHRRDWGGIAIVSIAGNAGPAVLFALAEQTVESSVAGMLNAAVPLATAAIAFALGLRSLRPIHLTGLVGGLVGVVLLSLPSVTGERPAVAGVLMVLLAVAGYALTSNVVVPLVHRYGAMAVIMQAQVLGVVLLAPYGLWNLGANQPSMGPILALTTLGLLGTGVARVVQARLAGRVGGPRASIVGYLVPVVALILGVAFRNEVVDPLEVIGLGTVLVSALLVTRAVRTAGISQDLAPATPTAAE